MKTVLDVTSTRALYWNWGAWRDVESGPGELNGWRTMLLTSFGKWLERHAWIVAQNMSETWTYKPNKNTIGGCQHIPSISNISLDRHLQPPIHPSFPSSTWLGKRLGIATEHLRRLRVPSSYQWTLLCPTARMIERGPAHDAKPNGKFLGEKNMDKWREKHGNIMGI
jgi:hypothetical protein